MKTLNEIERRPLSQLRQWQRNFRQGNVDAIKKSILRFGFCGCVRVWKQTVMAGNHAVAALGVIQREGMPAPKGIECQGQEWMVPCLDISHLSKKDAEAFAVADNRIHDLGCDDEEKLAQLLEEFRDRDPDLLNCTGFSAHDLESLLKSMAETAPKPAEEFPRPDDKTDHKCPKCGFEWSGAGT